MTIVSYFDSPKLPTPLPARAPASSSRRAATILTSAHVVTTAGQGRSGTRFARAKAVYVEFSDGDRVPAKIVGYDLYDDVAA